MNEHMQEMLGYLKLKGLLSNWTRLLDCARENDYSYEKLLESIIEEEYALRKERARTQRLRRAKIPEQYVIETFPFRAQPNLKKQKMLSLYDSFEYVTKVRNVIWIGPTGVGKTGLATAFLIQAINKGYSGRFILFPELLDTLYRSRADYSEAAALKKFTAYDVMLIDELGYVEVEPVHVGLFFTLLHQRHRRKTTLITSNLGFKQWNSFLKNEHLTASMVDRLTDQSYVINMKKCTSLRAGLEHI